LTMSNQDGSYSEVKKNCHRYRRKEGFDSALAQHRTSCQCGDLRPRTRPITGRPGLDTNTRRISIISSRREKMAQGKEHGLSRYILINIIPHPEEICKRLPKPVRY